MSASYSTVIGKMIKITNKNQKIPYETTIHTCTNEACANYMKTVAGSYCSQCGQKLKDTTVIKYDLAQDVVQDYEYLGDEILEEDYNHTIFTSTNTTVRIQQDKLTDIDKLKKTLDKKQDEYLDMFKQFLDENGIRYKEIFGVYSTIW